MAVVWEYVVAAVAFLMLWAIGSVVLLTVVPQDQLQSWKGICIQPLLAALAFLLARHYLLSALKNLREDVAEPDGE